MFSWPDELDREIRRIAGPEDEPNLEANGDPDSLIGEDDEAGFEEMSDYPDEVDLDDGFEDTEIDEDESDVEDDEDEECC